MSGPHVLQRHQRPSNSDASKRRSDVVRAVSELAWRRELLVCSVAELVTDISAANGADQDEEHGEESLHCGDESGGGVEHRQHLSSVDQPVRELEDAREPANPALCVGPGGQVHTETRHDSVPGVNRAPVIQEADVDVPDEVGSQ